MSLDDWVLALHLLSAFALVAAVVMFWVLYLALDAAIPGLVRIGTIAVAAGSIGTLVFGVWLAISLDAYQVWDGWVIAAIVLWAIAFETGRRSGEVVAGDVPSAEARSRALVLHGVSSLAILLLLIDMIWKPGA
jgi:hypothetical protein